MLNYILDSITAGPYSCTDSTFGHWEAAGKRTSLSRRAIDRTVSSLQRSHRWMVLARRRSRSRLSLSEGYIVAVSQLGPPVRRAIGALQPRRIAAYSRTSERL
jgi:hypothetical protein